MIDEKSNLILMLTDEFILIFVFLLGLAIGSFLNCVIYRFTPHHKFGGGLRGRSFCPHCKHKLSWEDLIPILSFVFLRGHCRYCRQKISPQYPLMELATGLLFTMTFCYFGFGLELLLWLFILTCLIAIFVYDLKYYIIPDSVVFSAMAAAFFLRIVDFENLDFFSMSNFGFGVLVAPVFFLVIILVSRGRWMGLGDVKLALLMVLTLGWPNILVAMFLAFLIGAIIGLGLIWGGKKTAKSEVPFGPFLVTGTVIALFWGEAIIDWYLQFVVI